MRSTWRGVWAAAVAVGMAACGGDEAPMEPAAEVAAESRPTTTQAAGPPEAPEAMPMAIEVACAEAAEYSESFGGRALLVLHRGEPIFERYADGWDETRPHPLASGTKSFVGVLAAAAVEDGLLDWDAKASRWIEEWRDDPRKSGITVRQLLDLSSGLDKGEATLGSGGGGPLRQELGGRRGATPRFLQPADKYAASIEQAAASPPGARFEYGPSHFLAFGELLTRALRDAADEGRLEERSVEAYLDRRILEPIGLGGVSRGWGRDRAGNLNLPGGGRLTARQWARFGEFVRLGGTAPSDAGEGIEVIDASILAECFKRSPANPRYGLTWWLPASFEATAADGPEEPRGVAAAETARNRASLEARLRRMLLERQVSRSPVVGAAPDGTPQELQVWMAAGLGKQRLLIVPALDLVVVRFGRSVPGMQRFDDARVLGPIAEAILAAELSPAAEDADSPEAARRGGSGEG